MNNKIDNFKCWVKITIPRRYFILRIFPEMMGKRDSKTNATS